MRTLRKKTKKPKYFNDGRWLAIYFGNRFKVARLLHDRRTTQEDSVEVFDTIELAQAEADKRNGKA